VAVKESSSTFHPVDKFLNPTQELHNTNQQMHLSYTNILSYDVFYILQSHLPEDKHWCSKHVEDIINYNISLEKVHLLVYIVQLYYNTRCKEHIKTSQNN
jgi:hypothetical protein